MSQSKPKVIKDFDKIEADLLERVKEFYNNSFADHLITFFNRDGKKITALPFETEEKQYLLRMTDNEVVRVVEEDEDIEDDSFLKNEMKSNIDDPDMDFLNESEEEPADEFGDEAEEDEDDADDY